MPSPSDNQDSDIYMGVDSASRDTQEDTSSERIDLNQVYTLVDSILPFEACLYYQVLPLFIEGSRLIIGMVNPEDLTASEYVKKQLSYINYSLTLKEIQSEWHRDILSKYLSHNARTRQQPQRNARAAMAEQPSTTQAQASPAPNDPNLQATFIVDHPTEIPDDAASPVSPPPPPPRDNDHQPESPSSEVKAQKDSSPPSPASPPVAAPVLRPVEDPTPASVPLPPNAAAPLHLHIDEQYRDASEVQLAKLPPKALMQALLSKVLEEGIGRLYFERRDDTGRILWSRDGILQAVLEFVSPQVFQGVINEFKLLTHLSLIATRKPRQVEIERRYDNQRILLRFRVMPNAYGEEATLQVLRGTALKFYQQQQIEQLGRDALDAAQRLQLRLNEIRDRARQSLNFKPTRSETLPAIIQLLRQMEAQVEEMVSAYDLMTRGESSSEDE